MEEVSPSRSCGMNSKADTNVASEAAVFGSDWCRELNSPTLAFHTDITVSCFSTGVVNGFVTSLATLKTTSNLAASSRLGSR